MLSNRTFHAVIGNSMTGPKKRNKGLPQVSVLAPLLFNLYISDMPETQSTRFGYDDDWVLAMRYKSLEVTENVFTTNLTVFC